MKILASKHHEPFEYKANSILAIRWSKGYSDNVCCNQMIKLGCDHIIDFAMIVQLDCIEAAQLGLVNAIGVIAGKKR